MKRLIPVFILVILLLSCRKSESDFIWEKSYGKGQALFIKPALDSGIIACGETGGNPYFIRFNKKRNLVLDFKAENQGLFSSAWFDTSGYILSGSSGGEMLLMRYSAKGNKLWGKTIDGGFRIDCTSLNYNGDGTFLATGTASPDSSTSAATGLLFVEFDTTGQVITEKSITETSFVAANKAVVDNSGNIFVALTRQAGGSKPEASVAEFNNQFQKLWETELYNNPAFGAASLAIELDMSGNVYVTGRTEVSGTTGVLNNSFLASLTNTGSIRWKSYLETTNTGSALNFDSDGDIMMLNTNCFIINILSPADGSVTGRIRMFSLCYSNNTDALGEDLGLNYDKNIMVAGSFGGNFYLALKTAQ